MESLERQETYVLGKRTILIIQFHLEKKYLQRNILLIDLTS